MEEFLKFFPLFILPSVIGFFVYLYISASKKHESETGISPIYEFRTGGVIGWIKFSGPFIRVSLYNEFIIISTTKKIKLRYNEFSYKKGNFSFTSTISLVHTNPLFPKRIELFYHSKFDQLLSIFKNKNILEIS
jgi:hypothetical protein